MKFFQLIFLVICIAFVACSEGSTKNQKRESFSGRNPLCPPESASFDLWLTEFGVSPQTWAQEKRVNQLVPIPEGLLIQFNRELNKTPQPLFDQLVELDNQISIFTGEDIRDHPTGEYKEREKSSFVIGTGGSLFPGSPANVVVNKMYHNYTCGLANVVLHEYGHRVEMWLEELGVDWKLDFVNAYPEEYVALQARCGSHFRWPHERFAEGFAAYFTCNASRQWMLDHMPKTSRVFEDLAVNGLPMQRWYDRVEQGEADQSCYDNERMRANPDQLSECIPMLPDQCSRQWGTLDPITGLCADECYVKENTKNQEFSPDAFPHLSYNEFDYRPFPGCQEADEHFCSLFGDAFDVETGECVRPSVVDQAGS